MSSKGSLQEGDNGTLLRVHDLRKYFPIWKRSLFGRKITGHVRAVDGVSFDIARGEVLGLVGESGCGKTTTGRVILRADTPTGGEIFFTRSEQEEIDLAQLDRDQLQPIWQNIQLIFQDPYSSLNPRMTLEQIVSEPLRNYNVLAGSALRDRVAELLLLVGLRPEVMSRYPHAFSGGQRQRIGIARALALNPQLIICDEPVSSSLNPRMTLEQIVSEPLRNYNVLAGSALRDRVAELLLLVGLRPEVMSRYPHAFSGGQRQRIGIARALALNPQLIICDEPVSALDVSIQAQILNLLKDLQQEFNLTYLFISHDLSVVRHLCDRVAVMYVGKIVEISETDKLFTETQHPYTEALLASAPTPDPRVKRSNVRLQGEVADPSNPPTGCYFHPRCVHARERCQTEEPLLRETRPGHWSACHFAEELELASVTTPPVDAA